MSNSFPQTRWSWQLTNIAEDSLYRELLDRHCNAINIGDSVASRQAAFAIYEGRKTGLAL